MMTHDSTYGCCCCCHRRCLSVDDRVKITVTCVIIQTSFVSGRRRWPRVETTRSPVYMLLSVDEADQII